jgi:orotate phosphoribosyltransferase
MRKHNESGGGKLMVAEKRKLLEIFRRTSFKSSNEAIYRLASGRHSRFYIDCKQALSEPRARALIGALIFELIKSEPLDAIGGLELGAYPIATSVSDTIFHELDREVRAFVIRKVPKSHGVGDLIAGHVERGDRTLIVDDVVTTGGSTIQAIKAAREAGLRVERAIVLVDREEDDGRKHIEAEGVRFDCLLTLSEFKDLSNECAQDTDARAYKEGSLRGHPRSVATLS